MIDAEFIIASRHAADCIERARVSGAYYIRADGRPDANGNGLVLAEVRVKFCSDAVVATVTKASTPFASNEFVLGSPRYGDVYLAAALALVLREVAGSMFFCATANKQSVLARTAVP